MGDCHLRILHAQTHSGNTRVHTHTHTISNFGRPHAADNHGHGDLSVDPGQAARRLIWEKTSTFHVPMKGKWELSGPECEATLITFAFISAAAKWPRPRVLLATATPPAFSAPPKPSQKTLPNCREPEPEIWRIFTFTGFCSAMCHSDTRWLKNIYSPRFGRTLSCAIFFFFFHFHDFLHCRNQMCERNKCN